MKYILKYKIKSKYFGFVKEYHKEFETIFNIINFIANNDVFEWEIYKRVNVSFGELIKTDLPIGKQQDY